MATTKQIAFIDKIGPVAQKVCRDRGYGNASLWTCICQAALETGWGSSGLMTKANAFFGIKATGWNGKVYSSATNEVYDGVKYNINANFRAYDSLEDGVKDYFNLISGSRYSTSLKATNVNDCVTAIWKGGYATDPTYVTKIVSIYNECKTYIEKYTVVTPKKYATITLQSFFNYDWGQEIKSNSGSYSGLIPYPISGVRAKSDIGQVTIQSRLLYETNWLGKCTKYVKNGGVGSGYSGLMKHPIDGFKMWITGDGIDPSDYEYRAHWGGAKGKYGNWISCSKSDITYAGTPGEPIDAIEVRVKK